MACGAECSCGQQGSGEVVAWLVGEPSDSMYATSRMWDVRNYTGAESQAAYEHRAIYPLHRGPIHADYRKPRQCEYVGSAQCWRNSGHQGAHIYSADAQQPFTWGGHFAGGETLQDAIVAAVRDRDAREAAE